MEFKDIKLNLTVKLKLGDIMNREIHKIYDLIMKLIILLYLNEFLTYIGEERKITEILNTEIPTLKGKTRFLDFLCKLDDDTICNIEFQFPVAYSDDLERFFDYNIVVEIDQNETTDSIVINFTESGMGNSEIEIGNSKNFHPKNVYLGDIDYIEELEKIKKKVYSGSEEKLNKNKESNIQLTFKEELHILIMCLLPKYEDKITILLDISELLKHEHVFRKEKINVIKAIINLQIKNLISKENQEKFEGDENMNQELSDVMINVAKEVNKKYEQIALEEAEQKGKKEGIKKGKEEGIKKGKEEGIKEIAKKLKEIHTPEEIAKITGLSLQTIMLL